jgi:gliding motility-associated-like protein
LIFNVDPLQPASVLITANPSTTICAGTPVTFNSIVTNGGTSPAFQWQINGVDMGSTPTFTGIADGDVITLEMTSSSTCIVGGPVVMSNSLVMDILPSAVASVTVTTIPGNVVCENTTVTFVANSTSGPSGLTYQWFLNGAVVGTNSTFSSSTLADLDSVYVVINSTDPCLAGIPAVSDTVGMTVNPGTPVGVSIAASTSTICTGQNISFTSTLTPVAVVTYTWKINGTAVAGANASTFSSTSFVNGSIVSLDISYLSCGVVTTSSSNLIPIFVTNPPQPIVSLSKPSKICFGDTLTLRSNSATGNSWSTGETTQSITVGATGTYKVTVTDATGCTSTSGDVNITVAEALDLTLVSPTYLGSYNVSKHNASDGSIDLSVSGGIQPYNFYWSTQEITEDIANVKAGLYQIVIIDNIRCSDTAYITLSQPPALELPTVFTPNGDGQNDYFVIKGVEVYPGTSVQVYNRWGSKVFESGDYKNEWNGEGKSGLLPDGTYFIVAIAKETDGTEIVLKGYVELRLENK